VANLTAAPETVVIQDLTDHGVAPGSVMRPILGGPEQSLPLAGSRCVVKELPPYGVRVLFAAGSGYAGSLHGDFQEPVSPAPAP